MGQLLLLNWHERSSDTWAPCASQPSGSFIRSFPAGKLCLVLSRGTAVLWGSTIAAKSLACADRLGYMTEPYEGLGGGDLNDPLTLTDEEIEESELAESEVGTISYSGTDFDVEGLVRRLERGDIVVPNFGHTDSGLAVAGFQRSFVWRRPQMDRFIESLLLGFPIPAIMLVLQPDKRYLVLDGQQRLKTLQHFYNGTYNDDVFALSNVAEEFKGLTYKTLSAPQKRMLDSTFIQAIIVRMDKSHKSQEPIYQVFERLNSGGTQLTPHEIRVALYSGPLVSYLAELNKVDSWRKIYGRLSPRLRDQEVVLRIIALYTRANEYLPPLKKFLNTFMSDHRDLDNFPQENIHRLFVEATTALESAGVRDAVRRAGQRVNAALLESVVVVYMRRIAEESPLSTENLETALIAIGDSPSLQAASASSTTSEENVRVRLSEVARIFASDDA
ncbi:Uncharacterized conserved protein [Mycobacteroides abscessus subsp. massiliense]|nr:Uncharacterized conserved protein [Mycobacteroides abscessus subsp. massiliense]SKL83778.1 Uncharacterized conserved protein [Mycobacteroides abscessus subsp. massiliense]SKS45336.1 Uncharacterized conserved protein [Mycobacteroides abscessus subsp. massiliense]SKU16271.1 Uncharacterized conserved protein [Mycobacteroides abscessus subsp. massiliense]SKU21100.1 Uncharacterized conserved protein [Mycobacteroides abscessus subsp. massiliense]